MPRAPLVVAFLGVTNVRRAKLVRDRLEADRLDDEAAHLAVPAVVFYVGVDDPHAQAGVGQYLMLAAVLAVLAVAALAVLVKGVDGYDAQGNEDSWYVVICWVKSRHSPDRIGGLPYGGFRATRPSPVHRLQNRTFYLVRCLLSGGVGGGALKLQVRSEVLTMFACSCAAV